MRALSILYLGSRNGTSLDRANALRRLGHQVVHIELRKLLPGTAWVDRVIWRLGGHWFGPWIAHALEPKLAGEHFDLCHVDSGELVSPTVLRLLHRHAARVLNYNIDDPLGNRDRARFIAYRRSLPYYDLCAVVRQENVEEAQSMGARAVIRVYRSADEITHAPRSLSAADRTQWNSEVLFLGTWFPERGAFLVGLIERGIPLSICGPNWHKAPEWPALQPYWRVGDLRDDNYAKAIQCAKVNLGMLSKGNRDLHTTRSLEIPALGGLLCAERTVEHTAMYREGEEALFWGDVDECAAACRLALSDESLRNRIAAAGRARLIANGYYNEKIMSDLVARALQA
jgi:hypothetical protein